MNKRRIYTNENTEELVGKTVWGAYHDEYLQDQKKWAHHISLLGTVIDTRYTQDKNPKLELKVKIDEEVFQKIKASMPRLPAWISPEGETWCFSKVLCIEN